jgi:hypothetical protein
MARASKIFALMLVALIPALSIAAPPQLRIKAANKLPIERKSQTIELSKKDLLQLGETDLTRIHIQNSTGAEVLCQAIDSDGDYAPDMVIFQADFLPNETKVFTISSGAKWTYTPDQFKVYGRFVRERFDDFAWENDRIAHRMYGKALETWVREQRG